ncbi:glycosyltransferase [Paenibacillus sp. L3-i20]|uniref:glycosyltransferase n=1 Tax=Paenibacillus sp. L3-i20 TaxID=2905833 RepID=UPI001EDEA547|nr:glycosyltransferase [Paenibacillus sp. L3-i20]GKU75832.1 glycosyl transferase [Paenibacillus sp. L3-i20]
MINVLFISKSDMIGGLEKVLAEYVRLLNPKKYNITVMTGDYTEELAPLWPEHVRYKGLFSKRVRGLDRLLIHLPASLLHKVFVKETYDIEISFQEGYPTKLVSGSGRGTKKICWLHNDPYYFDFNLPFYLEKGTLKKSLMGFDEIVTVSQFIADAYRRYMGLDEMKVVYNPIDMDKLERLSQEENCTLLQNTTENKFTVCYAGRLSEEKQVELLIESIIELHETYNHLELIIIGDGNRHDMLEQLVREADAEAFITFVGFKANPYPYIASSSVLVCCSRTESFGLVLAEALALGVPVIATKCGGPEEILDGGKYGLLVDQNSSSLSAALERLMTDATLYSQFRNDATKAVERFQSNQIIQQIEQILDKR